MKNKDSESISPHCVTSFSSVPKGGDTEAKKKKVKKEKEKIQLKLTKTVIRRWFFKMRVVL